MPPRFVYGDSYGGVQSAQQAMDAQSSSNYFQSLAAADRSRQTAQQAAEAQARIDEAQRSSALDSYLKQQELAARIAEASTRNTQWQADYGLRSRAADEAAAGGTEQMQFMRDQLAQQDRLKQAEIDAQRERYSATPPGLREAIFRGEMDVSKQGIPFASVDEVMKRYQGAITPAEAQIIFDRSQAEAAKQMQDYNLAQALARANKQRADLGAQITSTDAAIPGWWPWNWPAAIAGAITPGPSVRSQLGSQLTDLNAETAPLDQKIQNLSLRLNYPTPPAMQGTTPFRIPRTIVPVQAAPPPPPVQIPIANGAPPWPSSAGFDPQSLVPALPPAIDVPSVAIPRGLAPTAFLAHPSTPDEFAAIPRGTRYVNPRDGLIYTKN